MPMAAQVIRFRFPLHKADLEAIRRLEEEFDDQVVGARVGLDGARQVRTASGETYNLDAVPKFRNRRSRTQPDTDPLPPAPAAALRVS